jgi:hypothetical protein
MTNFVVYLVGVVVLMCAVGYGAHVLGASNQWVGIGVAAGAGLGIMAAIVKTRRPQSSN